MIDALLRHFDVELTHALADVAQATTIPAGTCLFAHGSPCQQFLLLLDGVVRVLTMSPGGREIVLYRLHPGESCVMTTSCLLGDRVYRAEGIAETAIKAAVIPDQSFERLLVESKAFRSFVLGAYAKRLIDLIARVEEVALERIDVRLARLLLLLTPSTHNTIERTHQDIAADLGSAREVVSRQLKSFEQHGWVTLERGRIVLLDRRALAALSSP